MATLVETDVVVTLAVHRGPGGEARVWVDAAAVTADGDRTRSIRRDITDDLSAARQTGATALLNDVAARLKVLWGIE